MINTKNHININNTLYYIDMVFMDRSLLKSVVDEYLCGFDSLYMVTLDDALLFRQNGLKEIQFISTQRKVEVMVDWLREKLVGKSGSQNFRAVSFFEDGRSSGMIHAHVLVGLKSGTDRSVDWMRGYVQRKWDKLRRTHSERTFRHVQSESIRRIIRFVSMAQCDEILPWEIEFDGNSDVREIYDLKHLVGYASKDFTANLTIHQFSSYMFH